MKDKMNVTPIIMAGGQGTRFWPASRTAMPKQYLSMFDDGQSLLANTVKRVSPLVVNSSDIMVVTSASQVDLVKEHAPSVRIVAEPQARNTAATNALAAVYTQHYNPDSVIVCLPSDHYISNEAQFISAINCAVQLACEKDLLVTLGATPNSPHTGYGYIKTGEQIGADKLFVERFVEKPDLETAKSYLRDGGYLWNMGIFIWRPQIFLDALKQSLPAMHASMLELQAAIGSPDEERVAARVFEGLEAISVDYGVMEKADNVAVVPGGDLGWNDVGSWDSWAQQLDTQNGVNQEQNSLQGEVVALNSRRNIVSARSGRFIALLDCDDMVVIDTDDALLVCSRGKTQNVRQIVDELKAQKRMDLL